MDSTALESDLGGRGKGGKGKGQWAKLSNSEIRSTKP